MIIAASRSAKCFLCKIKWKSSPPSQYLKTKNVRQNQKKKLGKIKDLAD